MAYTRFVTIQKLFDKLKMFINTPLISDNVFYVEGVGVFALSL
jgi:hypothetical protein